MTERNESGLNSSSLFANTKLVKPVVFFFGPKGPKGPKKDLKDFRSSSKRWMDFGGLPSEPMDVIVDHKQAGGGGGAARKVGKDTGDVGTGKESAGNDTRRDMSHLARKNSARSPSLQYRSKHAGCGLLMYEKDDRLRVGWPYGFARVPRTRQEATLRLRGDFRGRERRARGRDTRQEDVEKPFDSSTRRVTYPESYITKYTTYTKTK